MADRQIVTVPQHAFYGDTDLKLPFPVDWEIERRAMPGANAPELDDHAIRRALAEPIASPRLRDLAKERTRAVICFDDMARPTPVSRLWPFVVKELHAGGMTDRDIRFVCALGTHGAHTRDQFVRKLGEEALCRFPVWNHNPYQHCTLVGTTDLGTPVEINNAVLDCDLRIGIGSVLPHPSMGFGGGPKIVLPGVASFRTICANHRDGNRRLRARGARFGAGLAENPGWQDLAQAARLAGLDFVVNSILNEQRGVTGLVAGDVIDAWRAGVRLAKHAYATTPASDADIVISNGYAKGNEAMISAYAPWIDHGAAPNSRDVVAITNRPDGIVVHYLQGDFGPGAHGDYFTPAIRRKPAGVRNLIVFQPYTELSNRSFFGETREDEWVSSWQEVLARLMTWHPSGAKVVVYPDLTMQYLVPDSRA